MTKEKFNISFKKHPRETGLASVGNSRQSVDIKVNKKVCGMINAPNWQTKDNKWSISIILKKEIDIITDTNCDWVWVNVKIRFDTEEEARQYVKDNLENIAKVRTLHFLED